jgi:ABC-type multidrug transport system fused ATPase/permease subunit
MTSNEPYIGKNVGQISDSNDSNDSNIITNNIKLNTTNSQNSQNSQNSDDENEIQDMANTLWLNNPAILFDKNVITELWPIENMTREQKINAITRLVILLTLIGFLFLNDIKILITGIIAIVVLIFIYYILNKNANSNKLKETFSNEEMYEKVKHNFSNPTSVNPIMNVLLPEIQDNPNRLEAAPSYNNAVKNNINEETKNFIISNFDNNENIKKNLFNDQGDNFEFEQSMRQFYTTANTRVPNNQKDFARFCYGNMASCKDGDVEMCLKNAQI